MSGSRAQCRQTLKSFPTQHSGLNQHKSRSKSAPAPMLNHQLAIWCSQRTRSFSRGWEQHYWLWMTDTAPQHLHPSRNEAEPLGKHLFVQKPARTKPSYICMRVLTATIHTALIFAPSEDAQHISLLLLQAFPLPLQRVSIAPNVIVQGGCLLLSFSIAVSFMSQLYFNGHFNDYKNKVQHNKTAITLLREYLAKKQPLQDTIHCNIELVMQSKKPKARGKWGDGKKFSSPTVLPPQRFHKAKQKSKFLHCFLRKTYGVGKGEERVSGFLHIKHYSIYFYLPPPYLSLSSSSCLQQQELWRTSTDPESNNP